MQESPYLLLDKKVDEMKSASILEKLENNYE